MFSVIGKNVGIGLIYTNGLLMEKVMSECFTKLQVDDTATKGFALY